MSSPDKRLVSLAAFQKRVQGFIKDGYKCKFSAVIKPIWYIKMEHRNGHRVLLKFNTNDGEISQL